MEETLRQGGFAMDDEIPVDLMEELSAAERDPEEIDRPSISYWNMCWLRLKKISWPCSVLPSLSS